MFISALQSTASLLHSRVRLNSRGGRWLFDQNTFERGGGCSVPVSDLWMGGEQEMVDARNSYESRLEDSSKEQNPFFRNKNSCSVCSLGKYRKC